MKKKKENKDVQKNKMEEWEKRFNVISFEDDEDKVYREVSETGKCPCGGDIWHIDDMFICGHCNRKWFIHD